MEKEKLFVLDQNENSVISEELLKIPPPPQHSPLVTVVRGLWLGMGEG